MFAVGRNGPENGDVGSLAEEIKLPTSRLLDRNHSRIARHSGTIVICGGDYPFTWKVLLGKHDRRFMKDYYSSSFDPSARH
jgi:hypothetical protein